MPLREPAITESEISPFSIDIDRHLENWVETQPYALALLHKRRGQWRAWRWQDVQREVQGLRDALRSQGFSADSRLALEGAYEPTLILLALAALSAGGKVVPVSRRLSSGELRKALEDFCPTHLYVQTRDGLARLTETLRSDPIPLRLYTTFQVKRQLNEVAATPLSNIYTPPAAESPLPWRCIRGIRPSWAEDGTEWEEGLNLLLRQLLERGEVFAFPENSDSAARDRRNIAPGELLLSAARMTALNEELGNRLPQPGSLLRRLWDWSCRNRHGSLQRLVQLRVERLLGLHRLSVAEVAPAASRVPAWFPLAQELAR